MDRDASDFLMRSLRKLHRWGVPLWFDYGGAAAGFLLSALIELSRLAFLPARFPSVADVAANTFGAMVGALLALVFMARHEHAVLP
ncbi:VanZ family protein [Arthrobacter sp. ok909]|uniref:VanZ family protein n=1 Tax=Arthrobacter sp. ok909 TaxID=1761746 RepID=UPI0020C91D0E|nr:VanZ family protein [Arthrobacter sp. ok909]